MSDLSFSGEGGSDGDGFNWLQLAVNLAALSDTPDTPAREGRRLSSLQVLTARAGQPITRIYGRMRIGGQIIWRGPVREHVSESGGDDGDKGGGGASSPVQRSFRYSMHLAIGLCEGPISHIGRIWADGRLLDGRKLNMSVHHGHEDAAPDPLIAAAYDAGDAPAFRGLAYIMLRDLDLSAFGNRVPQLSFEVFKPVATHRLAPPAVCLLPGANEFAYHPEPHIRYLGPGRAVGENITVNAALSDWEVSLDQLQEIHPECRAVALVVSWFGTDLRVDKCRILPKVDNGAKQTLPSSWSVAGIDRHEAETVSLVNERPAFGGTPSDASVVEAIRDLHRRGLKVMFYPFIMMDIPPQNSLQHFDGSIGQPPFPWRGHIGADRPSAQNGTPLEPRNLNAMMDRFVDGKGRDKRFCLRGMILHYARLCAAAGGVDAFLIGSELRGVSQLCDVRGRYAFADKLVKLAGDAKEILPQSKISYAADWSEYGSHVSPRGDIGFPLDNFWGHNNCDFIGIDNYLPLSDWRDGTQHADAQSGVEEIYDPAYLAANVRGGEYFDWYYANDEERAAQLRRPIENHAGAWRFRAKDIRGWWENKHHPRLNNIQQRTTKWRPRSKPVWFTELGCPAVDKGANQPNVFPDPKSIDGGLPHFSDGSRDDLMQSAYLRAMQGFYENPANNPLSPTYGGAMVDMARIFYWAWDARPFPAFPYRLDVWSDGGNWHTGHWLNGRDAGAPLAVLLGALAAHQMHMENVKGHVEGYALRGVSNAARDISPLLTAFGIDALPVGRRMRLSGRAITAPIDIHADDILPHGAGAQAVQRGQKPLGKLPNRFDLHFLDAAGDYGAGHVSARYEAGEQPVARLNLPVAMGRGAAQILASRLLHALRGEHETISMRLPLSYLNIEIGDIIRHEGLLWRVTELTYGHVLELHGVRHQPQIFGSYQTHEAEADSATGVGEIARPELRLLELPAPALRYFAAASEAPLVAAFATPWPQNVQLRRDGAPPLSVNAPSLMGMIVGALPAVSEAPVGRWDRHTTLEIKLYGGTLASLPESEVLAGGNRLAVETDAGWELIQFARAELIGAGHYRLSHLLRGQFGSDYVGDAKPKNDAAVIVLGTAQIPLAERLDLLPQRLRFRFGPPSLPQDGYGWQDGDYEIRRTALACLSPVHGRLAWPQGFGEDWHIDWVRRTRFGGDDFAAAQVPLGEAHEAYRLMILADGKAAHHEDTDRPHWILTPRRREACRQAHARAQNWCLRVQQLNDRNEAGAPLDIPLPMNEAEND